MNKCAYSSQINAQYEDSTLKKKLKPKNNGQSNKSLRSFSPYASLKSFNRNFTIKQKQIASVKPRNSIKSNKKACNFQCIDTQAKCFKVNSNLYISLIEEETKVNIEDDPNYALIDILDTSCAQKSKSLMFQISKRNQQINITQDKHVKQGFPLNINNQKYLAIKLEQSWKIIQVSINNRIAEIKNTQSEDLLFTNQLQKQSKNVSYLMPFQLMNERKKVRISKLLQRSASLKINWNSQKQGQNYQHLKNDLTNLQGSSLQQTKRNLGIFELNFQQKKSHSIFKIAKQINTTCQSEQLSNRNYQKSLFQKSKGTIQKQRYNYQRLKQNRPRSSFKSLSQKNQYFLMKQSQRKISIKRQSVGYFADVNLNSNEVFKQRKKTQNQTQWEYGIHYENYQNPLKKVPRTQKHQRKVAKKRYIQG